MRGLNRRTATALGVLAALLSWGRSVAADAPAAELARWRENLLRAGASAADLMLFEGKVYDQSPADFGKFEEQWRSAPAEKFGEIVWQLRREGIESAPAPLFADGAPICSYQSLRTVSVPNTTIESVSIDPVDGTCRVAAVITHPPADDRVRVFIGLPMKGWNGRFRGTGGSGFWGGNVANLRVPLAKGYAAGSTDAGHEGGSGSFALGPNRQLDWQAIRDNAYLAVHDMTVVGKALTRAFYGRPPGHSYFAGLSTGGRQGLMEAQRYPEDYDGIVSLSPAINLNRIQFSHLWPQLMMLESGDFLPKEKLEAATAAAIAACDSADGVIDGMIADPLACTYDPQALVGTVVGGAVFTRTDAEVIRRIWEGPRGREGRFLWYGPARGADLSVTAKTEGSPLKGQPFGISLDWIRYFLLQSPQWDWTTLTRDRFELLWNQSVEEFGEVTSGDNPDLAGFRDRGGKAIIIHGLADPLIPVAGTVDYYKRVQQCMGGARATATFARLFLVPGANHAFTAKSLYPMGTMESIIRWVEAGEAPDRIDAESRDERGALIRTRPVFAYPREARYRGTGSTDEARNFVAETGGDRAR